MSFLYSVFAQQLCVLPVIGDDQVGLLQKGQFPLFLTVEAMRPESCQYSITYSVTYFVTYFVICFLPFFAAYFLAFFMTFFAAYFLAFFITFFLTYFLPFFAVYFLTFFIAFSIVSFSLPDPLVTLEGHILLHGYRLASGKSLFHLRQEHQGKGPLQDHYIRRRLCLFLLLYISP